MVKRKMYRTHNPSEIAIYICVRQFDTKSFEMNLIILLILLIELVSVSMVPFLFVLLIELKSGIGIRTINGTNYKYT